MLLVRKKQREAITAVRWIDALVDIHKKRFPHEWKMLGPKQFRHVVMKALSKGRQHGFTQWHEIWRYVTLVFLFGSYFDEDPLLPWISDILETEPAETCMTELFPAAMAYIASVAGKNGEYYRRAFLCARKTSFDSMIATCSIDDTLDCTRWLATLYPNRWLVFDPFLRGKLVRLAEEISSLFELGPYGTPVVASLQMMLGTHFYKDPLHTWAHVFFQGQKSDNTLPGGARQLYAAALYQLEQYFQLDRQLRKKD